jgi:hypothetical protein
VRWRDPQTPEEWQEAVDLAEAHVLIESARQYGLITGGPKVNVLRCTELLDLGRRRGHRPGKEAVKRMIGELARGR